VFLAREPRAHPREMLAEMLWGGKQEGTGWVRR